MPKDAAFTMKLEPELREAFMAAAEAAHRPASQVVRELMREFVRRETEAGDYDSYVQRKVAVARAAVLAGDGITNETVEAEFAARRAGATATA